jgi:branched-chain amino acid transport system substrate-binding protein
MKKYIFIAAVFPLSLSLSLSSCGGPAGEAALSPGVTDSTVVVGAWAPLTGPAALWGGVAQGMDAYFKMINEEGGVHGRKIQFIFKDDAYDPSKTVPAVRELVQRDEIFAVVGGIGTATGMAVKDFLLENEVPWIFPLSGSHTWAYPPERLIFSMFPLYFDEAQIQVAYSADSLNFSKFAIIYQNDDFGKSGLVAAEQAIKQRGLELLAKAPVELTDTDLSSHAARLQQSGAEVVLLWVTPRHAAIIMGATAVMGYRPQWMASLVLSDMPLMYDLTKGAWQGVIFTSVGDQPTDTTNATINKYRAALKKYYPDARWGNFPYVGFLFGEPFVAALEKTGRELTREKLIETLENTPSFQGSGPPMSFGPGKRQGLRSVYLTKCLGPTEYEVLTGYIESEADPSQLVGDLTKN